MNNNPPPWIPHNRRLAREFFAKATAEAFAASKRLVVVFPFYAKEVELLRAMLTWMAELHPQLDRTCVLHFDGTIDKPVEQAIANLAARSFKAIIPNQYPTPVAPYLGWPGACNWAFRHACQYMEEKKLGAWLWFEPDAVPMKHDWLAQIEAEYAKGGRPFMGTVFPVGTVFPGRQHMNGVAVYPENTLAFAPRILAVTDKAWDVYCGDQMIPHAHNASHLMQHSDNSKGRGPASFNNSNLPFIQPSCVLYHPVKNRSLIDLLTARQPKTSILIVSFEADFPWLKWCLRSIEKFASGFHEVVIAVPDHPPLPEGFTRPMRIPLRLWTGKEWPGNGMVWHMWQKINADRICPSADFILHLDSDCIFCEPVTPWDYFVQGKPVLMYARYDWVVSHWNCDAFRHWQRAVERCLGGQSTMEFMRRFPAIHYRNLYAATRNAIQKHTGVDGEVFAQSCHSEYPQDFCEFNALGEVAWREMKAQYHWVNHETEGRPHDKVIQFWSHAPIDKYQEMGLTDAPNRKGVPIETIQKVLA